MSHEITGTLEFPYRYGTETVIYKVQLGLLGGYTDATIKDPEGRHIDQRGGFGSLTEATDWARDRLRAYWEEEERARQILPERHDELTTSEFNIRLRAKLRAMGHQELVELLIEYAWDELIEDFNNEIIEDWEQAVERAREASADHRRS